MTKKSHTVSQSVPESERAGINKLEANLKQAMGSDYPFLKRELMRLKRYKTGSASNPKYRRRLSELAEKIDVSAAHKRWRLANIPQMVDDPRLPITDKKDEIIEAIKRHQVVIVSGETGSGKTTQLPRFCLAAGRGIDGKIGCTQPRRIAATSVARRIAEELNEDIGQSVGYKIRFQEYTSDRSFIKIMTDGILLAEAQGDPYLNEYDTIVVDEAHERSLNIDFILGLLYKLARRRKTLRVIITSATLDTEKFSRAFDGAPVIEVSGRMYPVDVRYEPVAEEQTYVEEAAETAVRLNTGRQAGDILIFMPTEQDIRETCRILEGKTMGMKNIRILPLFARLTSTEQSKVFKKQPGRKIIVATNVAETSITIPGIRYVVDTGFARISEYMPRSRTTVLPVVPISKSSADQRKGRCGRVENGICIRLYSEADYEDRPLYTPPEILRSNLAEVVLRMIHLKLGEVDHFPFVDPPVYKNIKDAYKLLHELGAIEKNLSRKKHAPRFCLTQTGQIMARMPLDPRLSRILIEARNNACLESIIVIASALSIQDPRERPAEKQDEADRIHRLFMDERSDFISYVNLWNLCHGNREIAESMGRMKRFCKDYFLSFNRMREWRDVHYQISSILMDNNLLKRKKNGIYGIPISGKLTDSDYENIHKSILTGFLSNIALKKDKYIYQGAGGKEVMIFPGSGIFNTSGQWIVAAEMVETSRLFARTCAVIETEWLEETGKNQCAYHYFEPHWRKSRGQVYAYQQVSLFGLIIVPRRPMPYGAINPDEAADIFILDALVRANVKKRYAFLEHNIKCIQDVEKIEAKIRRKDILVSESAIFKFYADRLNGVVDLQSLENAIKLAGSDDFLKMKPSDLIMSPVASGELSLYPDAIRVVNTDFDIEYRFDPGKDDDGVTIKIGASQAIQFPAQKIDWLVPGLLKGKISALFKGLAKQYRKQLAPINDTINIVIEQMQPRNEPLISSLSRFIFKRFGVDIPADAWPADTLPDHLNMRICLVDPAGREICSARDVSVLQDPPGRERNEQNIQSALKRMEKKGWKKNQLTDWTFRDLPESISISDKSGRKWDAYPGLVPEEKWVNLKLFLDLSEAIHSHLKGVVKLAEIRLSREIKFLKKHTLLPVDLKPCARFFGGAGTIQQQIHLQLMHDIFYQNVRSKSAFESLLSQAVPRLFDEGRQKLQAVSKILIGFYDAYSTISTLEKNCRNNPRLSEYFRGLRQGLNRLVPENFIALYKDHQMERIKCYLEALNIRAQRAMVDFEKDQAKAKRLEIHQQRLDNLLKGLTPSTSQEKRDAVEEFFWMIEEYKISLFAQELKTSVPVSEKRLNENFNDIERMV